jgi:hypothetical protein
MTDDSELIIPDRLPTRVLSENNQCILNEALQKANQPSRDPAYLKLISSTRTFIEDTGRRVRYFRPS